MPGTRKDLLLGSPEQPRSMRWSPSYRIVFHFSPAWPRVVGFDQSWFRGIFFIPWSNVNFTHRAFRNPLRLPKLAVLGTPGRRGDPDRRECGLVAREQNRFRHKL